MIYHGDSPHPIHPPNKLGSLFETSNKTHLKNIQPIKMIKENAYLIMIVPTEELTLQELADYDKMPWVEVDFGIGAGEAAIIKRQY